MSRSEQSITKTIRLYRLIDQYIRDHGYSPSLQDIVGAGAFSSKFVCHWHVNRLKAWGVLASVPRQSRTIRLLPLSNAPTEVQKYFEDES